MLSMFDPSVIIREVRQDLTNIIKIPMLNQFFVYGEFRQD